LFILRRLGRCETSEELHLLTCIAHSMTSMPKCGLTMFKVGSILDKQYRVVDLKIHHMFTESQEKLVFPAVKNILQDTTIVRCQETRQAISRHEIKPFP
jgi:hypothetical protein